MHLNLPNVGVGSRDTRKDAVRWRATFDTNPVTRAVCRDTWRDWVLADEDSVKELTEELRTITKGFNALSAAFNRLGERMGYGGPI